MSTADPVALAGAVNPAEILAATLITFNDTFANLTETNATLPSGPPQRELPIVSAHTQQKTAHKTAN